MKKSEVELEELVKEVERDHAISVPPMFELFATLFSILIAIMFFIYPQMLIDQESNPVSLYSNMQRVMPQPYWACSFFVACMLKAVGLLLNSNWSRIAGLIFSSGLYITLAVCYAIDFPSIGAISFSCMAVFTLISVPLVKHTTIKHKEEEK